LAERRRDGTCAVTASDQEESGQERDRQNRHEQKSVQRTHDPSPPPMGRPFRASSGSQLARDNGERSIARRRAGEFGHTAARRKNGAAYAGNRCKLGERPESLVAPIGSATRRADRFGDSSRRLARRLVAPIGSATR